MKTSKAHSPIVVKSLFDSETHSKIKEFIDTKVPMLSVGVDNTSFVRQYIHNSPFLVAVHRQLKDTASELFGEPLKPSYVFLSMYKDGGTCPLHIDRPQCYRTIDYLVQQDQKEPWPIRIGKPMSDSERDAIISSEYGGHPEGAETIKEIIDNQEWEEILLNPNDAVLYSGTHSWHYRPTKLNGKADLVFFHFVKESFDGPLN